MTDDLYAATFPDEPRIALYCDGRGTHERWDVACMTRANPLDGVERNLQLQERVSNWIAVEAFVDGRPGKGRPHQFINDRNVPYRDNDGTAAIRARYNFRCGKCGFATVLRDGDKSMQRVWVGLDTLVDRGVSDLSIQSLRLL